MSWEPDYCTAEELFHFQRVADSDLQTDDELEAQLAITGASRAIDLATNRQFGVDAAPTTRFYRSKTVSPCVARVKIDDIMTTTGLVVVTNDGTDTPIGHTLTPVNNLVKGKPWTELRLMNYYGCRIARWQAEDVKVTGTFGWTAVPTTIKQACLLQANRFLARREAPFGVAGSPDQGSEMRLLARVDPDVAVLIARYVRWWA